ncbi:hypothetical protein H8N03_12815 [Ramlibacter sp. USB13]|uniref:Uncharacterized protein n=1 Tax=Ramlibacter cellulosilyticus TaxID=2764187 RepID=A0A923MQX7_9BURK|nr:hypothetical protein [Ramlibacter cellulosilyticus]MBC5783830.1 hypothetical protein [Ramlibacter cellulosilyticus]
MTTVNTAREAAADTGAAVPQGPVATLPQAEDLFMEGPPMLVEARLGLLRPGRMHTARRCIVFVLLTWAPLCVLTAIDGTLLPRADGIGFLADMGAFARSWVAGPLLLFADVYAARELSRIAGRFGWMCEMSTAREGFARIVESTRRLRDGALLELAVAATVLVLVVTMVNGLSLSQLPLWHRSTANPERLSAAGWWYSMVSLPLLLVLVVGWLWRLLLWTRFLFLVARLELPIVPEHPDRAGGMGFLGYSVRGFAFVAAAFGAIVAGAVANQVLHNGLPFTSMRYLLAGTAAACVVLFCAPLFVFAPRLAAERRRGMRSFGQLSTSFGLRFAQEWFAPGRNVEREVLDRGDFSAATDLYQVVDRVKEMRFVPLDRTNILMLAGATLVPFVPVALLAVPFETVFKTVLGLLI